MRTTYFSEEGFRLAEIKSGKIYTILDTDNASGIREKN